jgi:hypothetical protein
MFYLIGKPIYHYAIAISRLLNTYIFYRSLYIEDPDLPYSTGIGEPGSLLFFFSLFSPLLNIRCSVAPPLMDPRPFVPCLAYC